MSHARHKDRMTWQPCRYDCGNAAEHGGVCDECRQANAKRRATSPQHKPDQQPTSQYPVDQTAGQ